ncbi:glycoside hydrolase family 76 protein [Pendulispora rubella]|uniref:Glycoside hydrolase family 76 protein n=1 Tax=Pendulispora rubella TaxID=2741070 RepID=A0ABZ2L163_9BACT
MIAPLVAALAATICNVHCEPRDPAVAGADRAAAAATVWSRTIALHLSDADAMGWASIDNGDPGDEAWLDRSFDGGRTWEPGGSKLGATTIPSGRRGWRTLMYNVDDPAARGIGALRACGKAGNRPEIACTPWFRTAASTRVEAAATALMQLYDNGTGLWKTTGWWNSANALTAMLDYWTRTGKASYRYAIANTFDKNRGNDFTNEYLDDTGWWGLAWVRAYDLTGEPRYLDMAKKTAEYMNTYRDGTCGGGVWWRTDKSYKNAITNELFIKLTAALHNRIAGDTMYLQRARETWQWFQASGMINANNLVNDGLDSATCRNNGQTTWTYNQGVILGALVQLHDATGDASLLTKARQLADASSASTALNPSGILREPCEGGDCGADGPSFKGIYVRNLGELDRALAGRPYRVYLQRQADAAFARNRTTLDQYGLHWNGPFDHVDAARQHSGLEAHVAAY